MLSCHDSQWFLLSVSKSFILSYRTYIAKGYCFGEMHNHMYTQSTYRSTCAKASWADVFRPDMTKGIVNFAEKSSFFFAPHFVSSSWEVIVCKSVPLIDYGSQLVPNPHVEIKNRVLLTSCLWNSFTVTVFLPMAAVVLSHSLEVLAIGPAFPSFSWLLPSNGWM